MLNRLVTASLLLLLGSPVVAAPPAGGEATTDRKELRPDRRALRDDRVDLAKLRSLHAAYKNAIAHPNRSAKLITRLETNFMNQLRHEARESQHALRPGQPVKAAVRGARAADPRGAQADRAPQPQPPGWRQRIRARFVALQGKDGLTALAAKEALMLEAVRAAKPEVGAGKDALREDAAKTRRDPPQPKRRP